MQLEFIGGFQIFLGVLSRLWPVWLAMLIVIGASIGMARSEDFPDAPARLIQAADIALYRAKRNGPGNAELAIPTVRHAA